MLHQQRTFMYFAFLTVQYPQGQHGRAPNAALWPLLCSVSWNGLRCFFPSRCAFLSRQAPRRAFYWRTLSEAAISRFYSTSTSPVFLYFSSSTSQPSYFNFVDAAVDEAGTPRLFQVARGGVQDGALDLQSKPPPTHFNFKSHHFEEYSAP